MQLTKIIEKHGKSPENLIKILLEYQSSNGKNFISKDEVKTVAKELGITESRVYSVITFYSLFSTKPRGKYIIQVCRDVPCYVNGAGNVVKELEDILGVKMGETTKDGVFTLEYSSCLGCCDQAPALRIGKETYGKLDREKITQIISSYRRKD